MRQDLENLTKQEADIRNIATMLHSLWCPNHSDCTWGCENWSINENDSNRFDQMNSTGECTQHAHRSEYYNKACKFYQYFCSPIEVGNVLKFINHTNPSITVDLIKSL